MPLDFEVTAFATRLFAWEVFDCATGAKRGNGLCSSHEAATLDALSFIAGRTPGTVFVARTRNGWSVWYSEINQWVPLPFSTAADIETVRAGATAMPLAAGKTVSIITSAV